MRKNWIAFGVIVVLTAAAVAVPVLGKIQSERDLITLHARMAENGGWTPQNLTAEVGVPLKLRLTSDDVLHSFAIGQSDQPAVDVKPGEMSETTLVFDYPGKYTFYCTRWCGANHWRMRGTIEVSGPPAAGASPTSQPPLYAQLGINIDQPHPAVATPPARPDANSALDQQAVIDPAYRSQDYYLTHSPAQAFQELRANPALRSKNDQQVWNLVAKIWQANFTPLALAEGQKLYNQNCAACHGTNGDGQGVMARNLQEQQAMEMGREIQKPASFTDPATMLGASPALLQGKIIRGGMGTGMPYWGPVFTERQTWDLVAYLWSFQFNLEDQK
ncbi:MAG TPA: c-type cytochrome [Anaerolineales bacterium]